MASSPSGDYDSMNGTEKDTAMDGDDQRRQRKGKGPAQITFQFCRECSNMLYPKEDPVKRKLMYACRTCQFSEPAATACVFRNVLSQSVGETAGVTQDVGLDPTLPRSNRLCPNCAETEAVFFQSQQRSAETGMKLFYVCCACGTIFQ